MNKIRLAQALVPIADELDERGLEEEASELDEIIQDLVAESELEKGMGKKAHRYLENLKLKSIGDTIAPPYLHSPMQNYYAIDAKIIELKRQLAYYMKLKRDMLAQKNYEVAQQYEQQNLNPIKNQTI